MVEAPVGTTNRIAEWAEISIGSLYQYFPNKDAILLELATRHLDTGIAAARNRLAAGSPTSIGDAIREVVTFAIDNHRQDPEFLRVLIEQTPRSRDVMDRVAELLEPAVAAMREILDVHPEVTVDDRDAAARLVVVTIESVVHQALAAPTVLDADRLQQELAAMLTHYLTG